MVVFSLLGSTARTKRANSSQESAQGSVQRGGLAATATVAAGIRRECKCQAATATAAAGDTYCFVIFFPSRAGQTFRQRLEYVPPCCWEVGFPKHVEKSHVVDLTQKAPTAARSQKISPHQRGPHQRSPRGPHERGPDPINMGAGLLQNARQVAEGSISRSFHHSKGSGHHSASGELKAQTLAA